MASLTFIIEPDEVLGLSALVGLDKAADGGDPGTGTDADAVSKAKALMRTALAGQLQEAGLPWAPSAEAAKKCATEAAEPASGIRRIMGNETARKAAGYMMAAAFVVVLWGGYIWGWPWTGFRENSQLWDWLTLLLLPVVLGSIPLWIQHRKYIGRGRRIIYAVVVVAWTGFVIVGYLIPITWTGFSGQKLWNWLGLLVLPAAVATAVTLFDMSARGVKTRLRPYQTAMIAALAAGWVVTVIGGYALQWKWTGYAGKALWDWLLLLLPLVFPIILLPPLVKWVAGNAPARASAAQGAAVAGRATGNAAGRASTAGEAGAQPAAQPASRHALIAIAAAGVVIAVAVGGDPLVGGGKSSPPAAFPSPCSAHAAAAFTTARPLSCVHLRWTAVNGRPFDAAVAGNFGFVSYGNGLAVMNTAKSPPQTIHRIPLASAQGEALTLGNNYLLVSGGSGAAVFKVSDLIRGKTHPLKLLNSPGGRYAVEVAVTPDGRFAFITLQHSNQVAVFDLFRALASRAYRSTPVRKVGVGPNPIGIAAAPDGSYLYVATGLGDNCKTSAEGSLVVLDAATAEGKAPGPPIKEKVDTESGLARVITSPDGKDVWATAGCGNTLQAYSAAKLIHDPGHAQIAQVHVGQAPLGLVMVDQGRRIVLADSDRYHAGAQSNLVLIDVAKASAYKPAILGIIKSGKVPRQFALAPDGKTLLVTNTNSQNVEVINVGELP